MAKEKTLTVVIPSYNVSKYLPEILPTYFASEIMDDLELLIVNDGSKDNTREIAEAFAAQYPETILVINKENGGHGSTINAGAAAARGRYFKVIDGDDWVDTDSLVRFVAWLKDCSADVVLNSFVRVTEGTGETEKREIQGLEAGKIYTFSEIMPVIRDSYAMHGTTFRTDVFRRAAKIDEHCFYVDQEYLMYPLPHISTAVYVDIPVYQYRVGSAEQSMSLQNMQKNRAMHERVIMSLLDMLPLDGDKAVAEDFILYRAGKMCQLQVDILFSMGDKKSAKRELADFYAKVKGKNSEAYRSIPGKKTALIRTVGMIGYDLLKTFKRG